MNGKRQQEVQKKSRKIGKYAVLLLLCVIVGSVIYGAYRINHSYQPNALAEEALLNGSTVEVIKGENIAFVPKVEATKGFIFYPGGLVEPEAYAPLCRGIAEQGYLVVIVPMKWNLAILSPNRANSVVKEYPDIKTWAIGGHSLGGVMASSYAGKHDTIAGVVFYAAYPKSDELVDKECKVLSIYGSKDGVADQKKIKSAKLPKDATFIEIEGGNHSYFGSYGLQKGDKEAEIAPQQQTEQAVSATVEFLEMLP
ncbi:alpha/beta family hydrolase [Anaerosporobacter faecicola]|uniref:alpha/beta family hydrolase n=1 Tax=Anaerosporobacter faecicola TaxID=2718714 RepID=UPI00143C21AF|nr:alpha/beta family hydrolase [Anaerosporobacter faecicola]